MSSIFGRRKSYLVDHTMDDVPLKDLKERSLGHSTISTISGRDGPPSYQAAVGRFVETASQRRDRHRSHYISYCIVFVIAVGMSSTLGMWPYLHEELVPSTTKKSLGWVVAVNPLGQMLAAPALGLWANKTGSIRAASITSVVMFMVGNIMYALLAVFKNMGEMGPYYAMMVSRFIFGVSTAISSLCGTYLASSTTLEERTFSLSMLSVGLSSGFVVGPNNMVERVTLGVHQQSTITSAINTSNAAGVDTICLAESAVSQPPDSADRDFILPDDASLAGVVHNMQLRITVLEKQQWCLKQQLEHHEEKLTEVANEYINPQIVSHYENECGDDEQTDDCSGVNNHKNDESDSGVYNHSEDDKGSEGHHDSQPDKCNVLIDTECGDDPVVDNGVCITGHNDEGSDTCDDSDECNKSGELSARDSVTFHTFTDKERSDLCVQRLPRGLTNGSALRRLMDKDNTDDIDIDYVCLLFSKFFHFAEKLNTIPGLL
ncbi:uncharacterized protein [Cherax quadricarinatus]|uniref:uncharacterized protein isoform X3 n=1 Tax=Cherax quadricarinatus TaxID=27406 RepID=UPI00387E6AE3